MGTSPSYSVKQISDLHQRGGGLLRNIIIVIADHSSFRRDWVELSIDRDHRIHPALVFRLSGRDNSPPHRGAVLGKSTFDMGSKCLRTRDRVNPNVQRDIGQRESVP